MIAVKGARGEGSSEGQRGSVYALRACLILTVPVAIAACSAPLKVERATDQGEPPRQIATAPAVQPATAPAPAPAPSSRIVRGGGYYLDDGPGDSPPADLDSIPDAVPKVEPLHRGAMKPYVVMNQSFTPMTELVPYKAQGMATWYGRRYHGKPTSTGEPYDMYAMTAAHPTLPLPSYVRVTNIANGKSVVLRVNDRGPFIDNRLIDLSYTAAYRIGVLGGGSALVEVESIIPGGSVIAKAAPPAPPAARWANTSAVASGQDPRARSRPGASTPVSKPDDDPILAIAAAAGDTSFPPDYSAQAPAGAPASPTRAPSPPAKDSRGVYLQLGAFGSRENAESYLARAKVQLDWLSERLHVLGREGLFRVHAGPYSSSTEARQIADRVALALGVKPVVVTR